MKFNKNFRKSFEFNTFLNDKKLKSNGALLKLINESKAPCIKFWERIITGDYKGGEEIPVTDSILDPVKSNNKEMTRIKIRKVINSNSKPLLIEIYTKKANSTT